MVRRCGLVLFTLLHKVGGRERNIYLNIYRLHGNCNLQFGSLVEIVDALHEAEPH